MAHGLRKRDDFEIGSSQRGNHLLQSSPHGYQRKFWPTGEYRTSYRSAGALELLDRGIAQVDTILPHFVQNVPGAHFGERHACRSDPRSRANQDHKLSSCRPRTRELDTEHSKSSPSPLHRFAQCLVALGQHALLSSASNNARRAHLSSAHGGDKRCSRFPDGGDLLLEALERTNSPKYERDDDRPKAARQIQHCRLECLGQVGRDIGPYQERYANHQAQWNPTGTARTRQPGTHRDEKHRRGRYPPWFPGLRSENQSERRDHTVEGHRNETATIGAADIDHGGIEGPDSHEM